MTSLLNGASIAPGPISPGEIVALTGFTVGPRPAVSSPSLTTAVNDAVTLGGTSVYINGIAAPVLYTQADQTNIIIPWGLTGTTASVVVIANGVTTANYQATVAATSPGLFTLNASGAGQTVALNQDGSLNSATNSAAAGSVMVLYATGLGQIAPPGQDGSRNSAVVLAEAVAPVTATIGGKAAQVIYAGAIPGALAGLMQVEVVVPAGAGTGPVPVVITTAGASSQAGPTVVLK